MTTRTFIRTNKDGNGHYGAYTTKQTPQAAAAKALTVMKSGQSNSKRSKPETLYLRETGTNKVLKYTGKHVKLPTPGPLGQKYTSEFTSKKIM